MRGLGLGALLALVIPALAACDGRPLLYQLVPSEADQEVVAAFRMIDRGNAGRLTRAETDAYFQRRFAELDRNRDGFLDEAELKAVVPILGFKTAAAMIFSLDFDSDGRLSPGEFLRLSNYLFTRDLNRDGVLTLEEVKTPPSDNYVAAGSNAPGVSVVAPTGGQPQ